MLRRGGSHGLITQWNYFMSVGTNTNWFYEQLPSKVIGAGGVCTACELLQYWWHVSNQLMVRLLHSDRIKIRGDSSKRWRNWGRRGKQELFFFFPSKIETSIRMLLTSTHILTMHPSPHPIPQFLPLVYYWHCKDSCTNNSQYSG